MPTFNMAYVNVKERGSFIATHTLKSNAGDRKIFKKKNIAQLFDADEKSVPRDHCYADVVNHAKFHIS